MHRLPGARRRLLYSDRPQTWVDREAQGSREPDRYDDSGPGGFEQRIRADDGGTVTADALFHIERDGEAATVMVARDGQVVDAQGPRNHRNDARHWGERRLKAWGRGLRSVRTPRERLYDR